MNGVNVWPEVLCSSLYSVKSSLLRTLHLAADLLLLGLVYLLENLCYYIEDPVPATVLGPNRKARATKNAGFHISIR